jgi:hypothetical protein
VIVRSEPLERAGVYFVVRFDRRLDALPASAEVHIAYLQPGSSQVLRETFALPADRKRTRTLWLGVTGNAPFEAPIPIAWKIDVRDAQGVVLERYRSYLWELPEAEVQ